MSGGDFCAFDIGLDHLSELFSTLDVEPRGDPDTAEESLNRHRGLTRAKAPRTHIPTTLGTPRLYWK